MKPEPIYRHIGAIIRAKRRQRDWSQKELAQRLQISRATLASMETGRQRILAHQLYELAATLEMNPADLLPQLPTASAEKGWAELPMPAGLKPSQIQQLAKLIQAVPVSPIEESVIEKVKKVD